MTERQVKYWRFVAPLVPFLVAAAVVALKLPADAQYVGTDVGFSFSSPSRHIFDLIWYSWTWYGAGSVNLYNLSVAPFYALVEASHLFTMSAVAISHAAETLEFGGIGFGAYALATSVLGSSRTRDVVAGLCIALLAMFSYLGALALLIPASLFQPALIFWPCLIAWELRLLRSPRRFAEILAFACAVAIVLSLNLAHTVAGASLAVVVALATTWSRGTWGQTLRIAATVAGVVASVSLPFLLSIAAYHEVGGTTLFASSTSTNTALATLVDHVRISDSLSSFAGLLRLNTIVWFPGVEPAKAFENPFVLLSTFSLAALSVAGLLSSRFDFSTRRFWGVVFLASLFLAKGIHAPFGAYYATFLGLPLAAMFRESNDKFILVAYVAAIVLASIGLRSLQGLASRILVGLALVCAAIPFVLGQPFLDGFVVRTPADYASVDRILSQDPSARVFSVTPSNFNEQGSTFWYHGSNLDDALFRNPITYSTTFQATGLSAASIYGDDRLVSAQEYFADRQVGRILGIRYVLVHKDFTEGFDLGFSRTTDIHINGQRIAQAVLRQCERDPDLEQLFDGSYLRLYRVREADSPLVAFTSLHAVRGYGNALFPLLELSPGNRGFVFSGNQESNILDKIPSTDYADKIDTFLSRPAALLTSDQTLDSPDLESEIGAGFNALPVPRVYVGAMPPGDYSGGFRASETMALRFPIAQAARYPMSAFYVHRGGYSAVESNELTLAAATPPPPSPDDVGRNDPSVAGVLTSPNLVSREIDVRYPFEGAVHAFLTLSGTRATLTDAAVVKLTVEGDSGSSNMWVVLSGWESLASASRPRTLLGALELPDAPAVGALDLDLMPTVVSGARSDLGRALYRPGLHIVKAQVFVARSDRERFTRPAAVSVRLYDAGPDDYRSQSAIVSSQGVETLSMSGSAAHPMSLIDDPRGLLLEMKSTSEGATLRAFYRYPSWTPGQLVLRGYCFLQQSGSFSATITYRYAGKRFVKSAPVAVAPEREPFGLLPLTLDDPESAATSEVTNWTHLTIDLRPQLPDLEHSVVESVVVALKLEADNPGNVTFLFGPLRGYGNDVGGYPLTALGVNGSNVRPLRIVPVGADALVDFGAVAAAPPSLSITSGPDEANVPSAVALGAHIAKNAVVSEGKLLDPTLGTITVSSSGVVELGTTFNYGWALRKGIPRPAFGGLLDLGAWLSTQPIATTHFVGEGFTNAWMVPAGTYTVVFVPQVARDLALLALVPLYAIAIVVGVLLGAVVRRRRAAR